MLVGLGLQFQSSGYVTGSNNYEPWYVLLAYAISFIAGGGRTLWEALSDLIHGEVNIDLLMILAAVGAAMLGDWPEGAVLLFLFSLSHALEHIIMGRTRGAITALMKLTPDEATVIRQGQQQTIPVGQLVVGDRIVVRPSERIPADGVVLEGHTVVDQSPMTGESIPVERQVGDPVLAGTMNQHGAIEVEVSRIASETTLARMINMVESAQSERAVSQQFTEWFGQKYTWIVLVGTAAVYLIGAYVLGDSVRNSFHRAMTALVAASPCAVVISIPSAILSAIASAARGGVLFKGGSHLEQTALLEAMAFDKTGTLTIGQPQLNGIYTAAGVSETELLTIAAGLESLSEHPLARAVTEAARVRGIAIPDADDVEAVIGHGVFGLINGQRRWVGKLSWFVDTGTPCDPGLSQQAVGLQVIGNTLIGVADEHRVLGILAVSDTLRPTAALAIQELRAMGMKSLTMLSGDHQSVVTHIASQLGMEGEGQLLPDEKLQRLAIIKKEIGPVGMIGDGINDAPSLAGASVGFSLGGAGTDVALETADIVLMADDLRRLPYAIALARKSQQIVRQNLILAFGMMGTLLVLTFVMVLPLPVAVLGHEGSTVIVILNGLRMLAFPKPRSLPANAA
ncbi:MAG: heavy metal translocating P-type ATPase [Schlesneria sp.]|nr:heavy metal translocating P-type ATPase [Schlesneria sp.]